jgi:hypothetical protein
MPLGRPDGRLGILPPPCGFRLEPVLVPLDEFLPDYDVNEVHSTRVAASPDAVMAAVRSLTAREVPLLVALMAVRRLPGAVMGRRHRRPSGTILEGFLRGGFVALAERPHELVVGAIGRFWLASAEVRRVSAAEFEAFREPGYARAAFNMHAAPAPGGGTLLTTETRVQATDEHARRSFRRYWRVIYPGSAAIRRAWLRAIRRRAERARP